MTYLWPSIAFIVAVLALCFASAAGDCKAELEGDC